MTSLIEYRNVIEFLLLRNFESAKIIQQLREAQRRMPSSRDNLQENLTVKSRRQSVFDQEKENPLKFLMKTKLKKSSLLNVKLRSQNFHNV